MTKFIAVRLAGCSLALSILAPAVPALAQAEAPPAQSVERTPALPPPLATPTLTVGNLFTETMNDFRRWASRDTFVWLGVGASAALAVRTQDASFGSALSGSRGLHEPLEPGAIVGGTPFQLGAAVATYTIGRFSNSPRVASVGADLIRAQVVAEATTMAFKFAAGRTRPDGTPRSFPSGHASVTFASATVLQRHFGWKVGIPAYAVASYVAASRIQMKRHYLSDVAFGAALGIVAGRTVTVGRGDARFALGPMAAPGGGGVAFTWVGKQ